MDDWLKCFVMLFIAPFFSNASFQISQVYQNAPGIFAGIQKEHRCRSARRFLGTLVGSNKHHSSLSYLFVYLAIVTLADNNDPENIFVDVIYNPVFADIIP